MLRNIVPAGLRVKQWPTPRVVQSGLGIERGPEGRAAGCRFHLEVRDSGETSQGPDDSDITGIRILTQPQDQRLFPEEPA
jgi:hypothetical protein